MVISLDRTFRGLLLMLCVGLWTVALPTFGRGIVAPAVTQDLLTAGSLSAALVFHTLSVLMLVSLFERAGRTWP